MFKRLLLGKLWIFIRLLVPIFIGAFLFGRLLGVPSGGVPYFLFFLVGMTCWRLFMMSWRLTTRCLYVNRKMLRRKTYFPWLVLPFASATAALFEFLIKLSLIVIVSAYYLVADRILYLSVGAGLLLAAVSAAFIFLLAVSLGLWTSGPAAKYKDVYFTQRMVVRVWFFLTPVIYPLSAVPEKWRGLVALNPMAGLVETFKWGMLGIGQFNYLYLIMSVVITTLIFFSGMWFFHTALGALIDSADRADEEDGDMDGEDSI